MENLVSIIVPAYNVEKYIDRCMESLCRQSYRNLEIILVDDGSQDETSKLCDRWGDKDNRVVVIHQSNKGQCGARNVALDIMNGEYLMFVDSDDYIRNDMVAKMVRTLEENQLDFLRSAYLKVPENENTELNDIEDTGKVLIFDQKEVVSNFLTAPYSRRKCFTAIMCASIYKVQLFDGIRFPEGLIYEEGFVLPDIYLKTKKAGYIDESFYYYRNNDQGTMSQNVLSDKGLKSIDDWKEIHYKIKKIYPEYNSITGNRWVKGYLEKLKFLIENDSIDKDGYYKRKIINTLTKEYDYFCEIGIEKDLLDEIILLDSSVQKWTDFRNNKKEQVLSKIKVLFCKIKVKIKGVK